MPLSMWRFVGRIALYLPCSFAIWYGLAAWHLAPTVVLAEWLLKYLTPEAVLWIQMQGATVVAVTNFGIDALNNTVTPPPTEAIGFSINALSFGYGLPLLVALILATPLPDKWLRLNIGLLSIGLLQVCSLVVVVLKQLTFQVGSAFQLQQQWSGFMLELIALLYQLGFLLVPMLAPVLIWALLSQPFLKQLAPQLVPGGVSS